jgi:predicted nucleic acid-binding protein
MASRIVFASGVLIDSDVLIWFTRGNTRAITAIKNTPDWYISAVSYLELAQGCRNKTELKAMQKAFKSGDASVLSITPAISDAACVLVEKYALSHSATFANAQIASTAINHDLPLLTANTKHFSAVEGLRVVIFKP